MAGEAPVSPTHSSSNNLRTFTSARHAKLRLLAAQKKHIAVDKYQATASSSPAQASSTKAVRLSEALQQAPHLSNPAKVAAVERFISEIDQLPKQYQFAETVYLSRNSLRSLQGIQQFPQLQVLSCSGNLLADITELQPLAKGCQHVQIASFDSNPIASLPNYRAKVVQLLPKLQVLDGIQVTAADRQRAAAAVQHEAACMAVMLSNACMAHKLARTAELLQLHSELRVTLFGTSSLLSKRILPSSIPLDLLKFLRLWDYEGSLLIEERRLISDALTREVVRIHRQLQHAALQLKGPAQLPALQAWDAALAQVMVAQQRTIIQLVEVANVLHAEASKLVRSLTGEHKGPVRADDQQLKCAEQQIAQDREHLIVDLRDAALQLAGIVASSFQSPGQQHAGTDIIQAAYELQQQQGQPQPLHQQRIANQTTQQPFKEIQHHSTGQQQGSFESLQQQDQQPQQQQHPVQSVQQDHEAHEQGVHKLRIGHQQPNDNQCAAQPQQQRPLPLHQLQHDHIQQGRRLYGQQAQQPVLGAAKIQQHSQLQTALQPESLHIQQQQEAQQQVYQQTSKQQQQLQQASGSALNNIKGSMANAQQQRLQPPAEAPLKRRLSDSGSLRLRPSKTAAGPHAVIRTSVAGPETPPAPAAAAAACGAAANSWSSTAPSAYARPETLAALSSSGSGEASQDSNAATGDISGTPAVKTARSTINSSIQPAYQLFADISGQCTPAEHRLQTGGAAAQPQYQGQQHEQLSEQQMLQKQAAALPPPQQHSSQAIDAACTAKRLSGSPRRSQSPPLSPTAQRLLRTVQDWQEQQQPQQQAQQQFSAQGPEDSFCANSAGQIAVHDEPDHAAAAADSAAPASHDSEEWAHSHTSAWADGHKHSPSEIQPGYDLHSGLGAQQPAQSVMDTSQANRIPITLPGPVDNALQAKAGCGQQEGQCQYDTQQQQQPWQELLGNLQDVQHTARSLHVQHNLQQGLTRSLEGPITILQGPASLADLARNSVMYERVERFTPTAAAIPAGPNCCCCSPARPGSAGNCYVHGAQQQQQHDGIRPGTAPAGVRTSSPSTSWCHVQPPQQQHQMQGAGSTSTAGPLPAANAAATEQEGLDVIDVQAMVAAAESVARKLFADDTVPGTCSLFSPYCLPVRQPEELSSSEVAPDSPDAAGSHAAALGAPAVAPALHASQQPAQATATAGEELSFAWCGSSASSPDARQLAEVNEEQQQCSLQQAPPSQQLPLEPGALQGRAQQLQQPQSQLINHQLQQVVTQPPQQQQLTMQTPQQQHAILWSPLSLHQSADWEEAAQPPPPAAAAAVPVRQSPAVVSQSSPGSTAAIAGAAVAQRSALRTGMPSAGGASSSHGSSIDLSPVRRQLFPASITSDAHPDCGNSQQWIHWPAQASAASAQDAVPLSSIMPAAHHSGPGDTGAFGVELFGREAPVIDWNAQTQQQPRLQEQVQQLQQVQQPLHLQLQQTEHVVYLNPALQQQQAPSLQLLPLPSLQQLKQQQLGAWPAAPIASLQPDNQPAQAGQQSPANMVPPQAQAGTGLQPAVVAASGQSAAHPPVPAALFKETPASSPAQINIATAGDGAAVASIPLLTPAVPAPPKQSQGWMPAARSAVQVAVIQPAAAFAGGSLLAPHRQLLVQAPAAAVPAAVEAAALQAARVLHNSGATGSPLASFRHPLSETSAVPQAAKAAVLPAAAYLSAQVSSQPASPRQPSLSPAATAVVPKAANLSVKVPSQPASPRQASLAPTAAAAALMAATTAAAESAAGGSNVLRSPRKALNELQQKLNLMAIEKAAVQKELQLNQAMMQQQLESKVATEHHLQYHVQQLQTDLLLAQQQLQAAGNVAHQQTQHDERLQGQLQNIQAQLAVQQAQQAKEAAQALAQRALSRRILLHLRSATQEFAAWRKQSADATLLGQQIFNNKKRQVLLAWHELAEHAWKLRVLRTWRAVAWHATVLKVLQFKRRQQLLRLVLAAWVQGLWVQRLSAANNQAAFSHWAGRCCSHVLSHWRFYAVQSCQLGLQLPSSPSTASEAESAWGSPTSASFCFGGGDIAVDQRQQQLLPQAPQQQQHLQVQHQSSRAVSAPQAQLQSSCMRAGHAPISAIWSGGAAGNDCLEPKQIYSSRTSRHSCSKLHGLIQVTTPTAQLPARVSSVMDNAFDANGSSGHRATAATPRSGKHQASLRSLSAAYSPLLSRGHLQLLRQEQPGRASVTFRAPRRPAGSSGSDDSNTAVSGGGGAGGNKRVASGSQSAVAAAWADVEAGHGRSSSGNGRISIVQRQSEGISASSSYTDSNDSSASSRSSSSMRGRQSQHAFSQHISAAMTAALPSPQISVLPLNGTATPAGRASIGQNSRLPHWFAQKLDPAAGGHRLSTSDPAAVGPLQTNNIAQPSLGLGRQHVSWSVAPHRNSSSQQARATSPNSARGSGRSSSAFACCAASKPSVVSVVGQSNAGGVPLAVQAEFWRLARAQKLRRRWLLWRAFKGWLQRLQAHAMRQQQLQVAGRYCCRRQKRKAWRAWQQYMQYKQDKQAVPAELSWGVQQLLLQQHLHGKQKMQLCRVLQAWQLLVQQTAAANKAADQLLQNNQQKQLQLGLQQLKGYAMWRMHKQRQQLQAARFCRRRLIHIHFRGWLAYTRQSEASNMQQMQQESQQQLLRSVARWQALSAAVRAAKTQEGCIRRFSIEHKIWLLLRVFMAWRVQGLQAAKAQHKQQLGTEQQTHEALQQAQQQLITQATSHHQQLSQLSAQHAAATAVMHEQLHQASQTADEASQQLQQIQQRHAQQMLELQVNQQQAEQQRLQEAREGLKRQNEELLQQLAGSKAQGKELASQLKRCSEKLSQQTEAAQALRAELEATQEQLAATKSDKRDKTLNLTHQALAAETEKLHLQQLLEAQQAVTDRLQGQVRKLRQQLQKQQQQWEQEREQWQQQQYQQQQEQDKVEVHMLQLQLNRKDHEVEQLQDRLGAVQAQMSSQQAKVLAEVAQLRTGWSQAKNIIKQQRKTIKQQSMQLQLAMLSPATLQAASCQHHQQQQQLQNTPHIPLQQHQQQVHSTPQSQQQQQQQTPPYSNSPMPCSPLSHCADAGCGCSSVPWQAAAAAKAELAGASQGAYGVGLAVDDAGSDSGYPITSYVLNCQLNSLRAS